MVDLFFPETDPSCWSRVAEVLGTRWVGQGALVEEFEQKFQEKFCPGRHAVMVSSGTAALHLAYVLAGIGPGDEAISPNFTCTATNIPLLYCGATPVLTDIDPETFCLDLSAAYHAMTPRTKAIIAVNYGGFHVNTQKLREMAPKAAIITDAAQSLTYNEHDAADYICFSFQAIKHLWANAGCLVTRTSMEATIAKRLRWFGIAREAKLRGNWENDVTEIGYKYQPTNVEAAIGLGNLTSIDERIDYRRRLLKQYREELRSCRHTKVVGTEQIDSGIHDAWLCTVTTSEFTRVTHALTKAGVEHGPVHYRNSRYTIFKKSAVIGPSNGMDSVDGIYACLPIHAKVTPDDVSMICSTIKSA